LIRVEEISDGTLDTILVHPREVFKSAIAANAHTIVLAYNLCVAAHKLCYVKCRFMLSHGSTVALGRALV
jgi:DNA repair protein RadC